MCIFAFAAGLFNCAGNTVFNASMMLSLPEQNRSAILGFIRSASVGGSAISVVIYGFLGEFFPLYITFAIGALLSLPIMLFMCLHHKVKRFITDHNNISLD
jgi:MFS family permease